MQHVTIYCEAGRYAGWPANYGVWSWGNEIVVGFTLGYLPSRIFDKAEGIFHARDTSKPFIAQPEKPRRTLEGICDFSPGIRVPSGV